MKLWDSRHNRLAEFHIDIRGSWLHKQLAKLGRFMEHNYYRLYCGCEACLRSFLPWPFNW